MEGKKKKEKKTNKKDAEIKVERRKKTSWKLK